MTKPFKTWTPGIQWIGHDYGQAYMRPSTGGMWVSVSDLDAAVVWATEQHKCADDYAARLTTANARAEAAEAKLAALVDGLATVAEQSLCAEIPDGYGPDAAEMAENAEFNRGYDAAWACRAALAKIWASK